MQSDTDWSEEDEWGRLQGLANVAIQCFSPGKTFKFDIETKSFRIKLFNIPPTLPPMPCHSAFPTPVLRWHCRWLAGYSNARSCRLWNRGQRIRVGVVLHCRVVNRLGGVIFISPRALRRYYKYLQWMDGWWSNGSWEKANCVRIVSKVSQKPF